MAGIDRTQKGRKLTGIPTGGFQENVTKRWQFGEVAKTKQPKQFSKRLSPMPEPFPKLKTVQTLEKQLQVPSTTAVTPPKHTLGMAGDKLTSKIEEPSKRTSPPYSYKEEPSKRTSPPYSYKEEPSKRTSPPYSYKEEYQHLAEGASADSGTLPSRLQTRLSVQPYVLPLPAGLLTSRDSSILNLKRPSVVLPSLMEDEKYFHDLVKSGDIAAVQSFIGQRPDFNINCTNFQGITALQIAVESGNVDLVSLLLDNPMIEIGDCALHAIKNNNLDILKVTIEKQRSLSPSLEYLAWPNSAEFADNVTPLILAAEYDNYEIVGYLLDRGHIIPRPHKPRCFCTTECLPILQTQDQLTVSAGKLQIYKAISSPSYLCHSTDDPIMAAFKLSKELKVAGNVDTLFRKQYYELAEQTRLFAADIIGECRNTEEVEIILSLVPSTAGKLLHLYTFPRLVLAMDYKQKEFVASPKVQQLLEVKWIGDWYVWKGYRKVIKVLYVIPRVVMLPYILVVLIIMPNSNAAKFYALPINKMLSSVASYGIFLVFVFVQSNVDKKNQTKESQPTGVEIFLVIFILSYMWNTIRTMVIQGPRRFIKYGWNVYQIVMELLFVITFILWLTATIKATASGNLDIERKYWDYNDPELLAEGLFVCATVMAFLRILMILEINSDFGPLQLSIGKMIVDCSKYTIIMAIVVTAFTAALCRFYSYYAGMTQKDPETGTESRQEDSFTSPLETLKTLFWAIFGMAGYEAADVIIENLPDETGKMTVINEHDFTETVGYTVFAVYTVLMVVMILNMLIATMSNTYQRVVDNADTEWVYGKTAVYLQYINYPVLPPPFNLIPTTYGVRKFLNKRKGEPPDAEKGLTQQDISDREFHMLMSQLVQRYFNKKQGG